MRVHGEFTGIAGRHDILGIQGGLPVVTLVAIQDCDFRGSAVWRGYRNSDCHFQPLSSVSFFYTSETNSTERPPPGQLIALPHLIIADWLFNGHLNDSPGIGSVGVEIVADRDCKKPELGIAAIAPDENVIFISASYCPATAVSVPVQAYVNVCAATSISTAAASITGSPPPGGRIVSVALSPSVSVIARPSPHLMRLTCNRGSVAPRFYLKTISRH